MKKLIILFAFIFIAIAINAQDKTITPNSLRWKAEYETSFDNNRFNFDSGDTISNNDQLYSIEVDLLYPYPVKFESNFTLDSVSGDPNVALYIQERMFGTDSWTDLDTITWAGTSTDTTIKYTYTTSVLYAKFIRFYFDATATAQKSILTLGELEIFNK